jgi:hypothetical protein
MVDHPVSEETRSTSLDINDDMRFQERTWLIQRIGWWVMAILVLAGLTGVFAAGPLSRTEVSDPSGALRVEYERFQRRMAPSTLRLHIGPGTLPGDQITLRMSRTLAEATDVEKIVPQPDQARITLSGVEYTFGTAEPGGSASIRFDLNSDEVGLVPAEIALGDREPLRFTIFIYP